MDIVSRPATAAGVVALLLFAGCLSAGGAGPTQSTTTSPTATPGPATTGCPSGLAFYGLGDAAAYGWTSDQVAVGYSLPADSSALLVVFAGDAVLGAAHVSNTNSEYALAADGDRIPLDEPLNGSHEIRVVAFEDSNDNGRFDPGADAPCHDDDGDPVTTGPRTVDFDTLQTVTTDSAS